jgi:FkbM family methyltransferase
MIDVGAHFGTTLALFDGWEIYAFEPDTENWQELVRRFGSHPLIHIDQRAVSNKPAKNVTLYKSKQSTGISSLSPFHDSHYAAIGVDVTTLADFILEKGIDKVDFLKIDTEGYDYFVLQGFPWNKFLPSIILCEFENSKTIPLGYTIDDMAKFLQNKGYDLTISEWYPVKAYGTQHEWKQFTSYPCELDDNAWGNIIAARS